MTGFINVFFDVLWKSVSSRKYYLEILKAPIGFSLKYLFVLFFIMSVTSTLRTSVWILWRLPNLEKDALSVTEVLRDLFPPELSITLVNGEISTNVREPYSIKMPGVLQKVTGFGDTENLAVIDTSANRNQKRTYDTFMLLTKTSLIYESEAGIQVLPLAQDKEPLIVNRAKYDAFVSIVKPITENIYQITLVFLILYIVVGPLIGAIAGLFLQLLLLVLYTLFTVLIAKILDVRLSFAELYQISIHGITLPMIVTFILSVVKIHIPFLHMFIFIAWMSTVLTYLKVSSPGNSEKSG